MAGDGSFVHTGGVQVRVVGNGNLRLTCLGYNTIRTLEPVPEEDQIKEELYPIPMQPSAWKEEKVLANFVSQSNMVKFETTDKGEFFKINHIIVFVRDLWKEAPG